MPGRTKRRHSLSGRFITLSGGEIISKVCVLLAFVYLARALGPDAFGLVELSLSITLFFTLGVEHGLGSYGARTVAADPSGAPTLISRVVALRVCLCVPAYAVILIVSSRYGQPGIGILAIYGLVVLLVPFFVQWVFQGMGRMQLVAGGTVLRNLVFSGLVFALVRPGSDPRWVALAEVLGAAVFAAFNLINLRRMVRPAFDWHDLAGGTRRLFADAWTLGASELTWAALWYFPTLIVGYLADAADVAWLAGPIRVVMGLHTFVWLYFFNLLPGLSRSYKTSLEAWQDLTNRSISTTMWPALLVAIVGTSAAPEIVLLLFGRAYGAAAWPLRIVVWMIPIAWLSGHFRFGLIATGHQRSEFLAAIAAAVVSVGGAWIWVPLAGATGAALALVAGGLVNALVAMLFTFRAIAPLRVSAGVARPILLGTVCLGASAAMAPVTGAVVATGVVGALFGLVALRSDPELVRLRQVWLGR